MKKDWVLTQEAFDALLGWLDTNREVAAERYERIRNRLIKIFACRGCMEAEDLADETINRVTSKLADIQPGFEGDPARYFYAVAKKILLEHSRPKATPPLPQESSDDEETELMYQRLELCLEKLTRRIESWCWVIITKKNTRRSRIAKPWQPDSESL